MIKKYKLTFCSGVNGCENRAVFFRNFHERLDGLLQGLFGGQDEAKIKDGRSAHGVFRVAVSDCPNACSRPQIVDIGLIGASEPVVTDTACKDCGGCLDVCKEQAVTFWNGVRFPIIDDSRCVRCGACVRACSKGTIQESKQGYRILIGGRLGRHPRLGTEFPGIYDEAKTLEIVRRIVVWYLANTTKGERLADVMNRDVEAMQEFVKKP